MKKLLISGEENKEMLKLKASIRELKIERLINDYKRMMPNYKTNEIKDIKFRLQSFNDNELDLLLSGVQDEA